MKRAWNLFRELLGDAFIILGGFLMLYLFVLIEIFGLFAHEPNAIIRWAEIVMGPVFMVLGIDRFIRDLRVRKTRRENTKL